MNGLLLLQLPLRLLLLPSEGQAVPVPVLLNIAYIDSKAVKRFPKRPLIQK